MKKRILVTFILLFVATASALFFQNCSSNEFAFSSLSSSATVNRNEVDIGGGLLRVTDNFMVRVESQTMIDMVWIIDNSGSMNDEAAHVRNNVLAFATAVEQEARLKMALVSRIGQSSTATFLPDSLKAKGSIEIRREVASSDALMILGAIFCSKMAPLLPCAELTDGNYSETNYLAYYGSNQGALDSFFRSGAKKIIVAVTDDDSRVTGPDFLQFLNHTYPNERTRIFSFIGLGEASPCQARRGTQYEWLATETAGAVYNICSTDWTAHFSDLTRAVAVIANYEYELKQSAIEEVISVKINGTLLPPSAYTIRNGVLALNSTTLAGGALEIIYTIRQ